MCGAVALVVVVQGRFDVDLKGRVRRQGGDGCLWPICIVGPGYLCNVSRIQAVLAPDNCRIRICMQNLPEETQTQQNAPVPPHRPSGPEIVITVDYTPVGTQSNQHSIGRNAPVSTSPKKSPC